MNDQMIVHCKRFLPRLSKAWAIGMLTMLVITACGDADPNGADANSGKSTSASESSSDSEATVFTESAATTGLVFQHYTGAYGGWLLPEILGSGVALLDYDNDGDLDVYFVQSSDIDNVSASESSVLFPLPQDQPRGHRLFANQLIPEGTLVFRDVTDEAGLNDETYGMGVAVADYDNDGDSDIYVAGLVENVLYRNNGGTFEKQPNAGGAQDKRWSSSASFCDVNNDQLLDLYVTNYLFYTAKDQIVCRDSLGQQDYCGPQSYSSVPDSLFINQGDGTFVDRSQEWGVDTAASAGLGTVCRDLDQDGDEDIYVANDSMPNLLWQNNQHKNFEDRAQLLGAAINANGMSEGSMGIAVGDYDLDGDDDLFVTHWNNETNTLYRNDLGLGFFDVTGRANLASASLSHTGFGTQWLDVDNDSDLDLFVTNGAVQRYLDGQGELSKNYGQVDQLFLNSGNGRFSYATDQTGLVVTSKYTGRGVAFGDIDNDGDTDMVVSNKDALAQLYLNNVGQSNVWLGIQLRGTRSSKEAYGAVVTIALPAREVTLRRVVNTDGSYQSASDPRLLFGLDDASGDQSVTVHWPSGHLQTYPELAVNSYHLLTEGEQ